MNQWELVNIAERAFVESRPVMANGMNSNPERAAEALVGEGVELCMALQAHRIAGSAETLKEVGQEMADIMLYLMTIANSTGLDILDETQEKIAYNNLRFQAKDFQEGDYHTQYRRSKAIAKQTKIKEEYYQ